MNIKDIGLWPCAVNSPIIIGVILMLDIILRFYDNLGFLILYGMVFFGIVALIRKIYLILKKRGAKSEKDNK